MWFSITITLPGLPLVVSGYDTYIFYNTGKVTCGEFTNSHNRHDHIMLIQFYALQLVKCPSFTYTAR